MSHTQRHLHLAGFLIGGPVAHSHALWRHPAQAVPFLSVDYDIEIARLPLTRSHGMGRAAVRRCCRSRGCRRRVVSPVLPVRRVGEGSNTDGRCATQRAMIITIRYISLRGCAAHGFDVLCVMHETRYAHTPPAAARCTAARILASVIKSAAAPRVSGTAWGTRRERSSVSWCSLAGC